MRKKGTLKEKIINNIVLVVLIISIPVTGILASANLAFRIPDVYKFELNRSQNAQELNLNLSNEEISQFMADFMWGREKEFALEAEYDYREKDIFTKEEKIVMKGIRNMLNISLYILILSTLIVIFGYWFFLRKRKKETLRHAYKGGLIVYAACMGLITISLVWGKIREVLVDFMTGDYFEPDNLLPQLFGSAITIEFLVFIVGLSILVLVLGMSLTWKLTKPERIFWK